MIRKIIQPNEPSLRQKSKPVTKVDKKVKALIADLKETLKAQTDPEGVGLAAPQIGRNLRVFVMLDGKKIKTVINPEIVELKKLKKDAKIDKDSPMEGCLSIPHFYGPLVRPEKIKIKYLDEDGKEVAEEFAGFTAQIVQHEIDHLDGVLFVDRLIEKRLPLYEFEEDEWVKTDI